VPDYHATALTAALRRLVGSRFVAVTLRRLATHSAAIATELQQAVLADVPQFQESRNPDLLPELARHGALHLEEVMRLLTGEAPGTLEFVRDHARRRAEQRFALEATLHAYRSGHKVFSRWLQALPTARAAPVRGSQRESVAMAEFAVEYTDAISTTFATVYSAHTRLLADVAGDQRTELLQTLLEGRDESDPRVARILREAGFLDKRQVYCVALARSVEPVEMLNAPRARRLVEAIEGVLAASTVRRVIDVHSNKVTLVCADVRRESGWTAPRSSLAQRMSASLAYVGNAALIGISNDAPSTSHIPAAHQEAAAALELAEVTRRVVQFAEIPLMRLLLHYAGDSFQRVLPHWVREFHVADEQARGALAASVRAYASADMNMLRAADVLGVHPNTLYARFQRIFEITGLQPRSFDGLTNLLLVSGYKPADTQKTIPTGDPHRLGKRRRRKSAPQ
jgi:hypothetical protein